MNDNKYMLLALKQAYKSYNHNEVPVGAVIIENDKVLSVGYNRKEKNKCALDHAEIIAIRKACKKKKNWRLSNCIIYVTLEPCPMCASAIKQSRIKRVVYLYDNLNKNNKKIIEEILNSKDSNKPVEIKKINVSTINLKEINLLTDFFYRKRY